VFNEGVAAFLNILFVGEAGLLDSLVILCDQPLGRVGPLSWTHTYAIRDVLMSQYPSTYA